MHEEYQYNYVFDWSIQRGAQDDQTAGPSSKAGSTGRGELVQKDNEHCSSDRSYIFTPGKHSKLLQKLRASSAAIVKGTLNFDATRTNDGNHVMFKKFAPSSGTAEAEIALLFSAEPYLSNPKNRCIPTTVLGVPDEEDVQLLVMPLLQSWKEPKFNTVGEVVDFFHQVFEGLQYMHSNGVAHRDVKYNNILMDTTGLYSVLPHPLKTRRARDFRSTPSHSTRALAPVRYYFRFWPRKEIRPVGAT